MKRFFDVLGLMAIIALVLGVTASAGAWIVAILTDAPLIEHIDAKTSLAANAAMLILLINLDWLERNDR